MSKVSFPKVNARVLAATPVASIAPKRTIFIGQKLAAGTAVSGVVTKDIGINQETVLCGAGSMLETMVKRFRKTNETSQVDIIALDDNGTTKGVGSIVFTGNATKAGEITLYIGNKDKVVKVPVAIADTPTVIAGAISAAIALVLDSLVTAGDATGTLTLTAKNAGTVGNDIGILIDFGIVEGVTAAITAFAGGATDPDMTGLAALLTEKTDIVMPFLYGIATFKDLLDSRFNSDNKVLDGRLFTAINDTKSNIETIALAENSQSLIIFPDLPISKTLKEASAIFAMPYERSSDFAGVRSLRLEPGTDISGIMTTRNQADQIGGAHTASLPYANTLTTLPIIPEGEGYTDVEQKALQDAGVAFMGNNDANNAVIVGEVVTTYKTNVAGQTDLSFKFLSYVDTSTISREYIFNRLKIDYAQIRLTLGQAISSGTLSEGRVRASFNEYYKDLSSIDFQLLQTGNLTQGKNIGKSIQAIFEESVVITIDNENGHVIVFSDLPIMTQLREIDALLSIRFDLDNI